MGLKEFTGRYKSLLLFGPPGAGKGTVSKILAESGSHFHLSTGDVFRSLPKDSSAGRLFSSYGDKGLLVPDKVTIEVWAGYVKDLISTGRYRPHEQYLILDGIPRTRSQAEVLSNYIDLVAVIALEMPNVQRLTERLQRRAQIEGRNDDIDAGVIEKRMEVYRKQTEEVLGYYPKNKMLRINADQYPLKVLGDLFGTGWEVLTCLSHPMIQPT
ncbi:nucleoside monophosphate kinase [Simkania negevensis]|uniref:Adenylate kinase n=1 Tax=Simkania negevensis TaxID=83561 RepID=A0ABS3AQ91_9BACT|nr:nucleoside monophosphate kinase [Simkania negevensis]